MTTTHPPQPRTTPSSSPQPAADRLPFLRALAPSPDTAPERPTQRIAHSVATGLGLGGAAIALGGIFSNTPRMFLRACCAHAWDAIVTSWHHLLGIFQSAPCLATGVALGGVVVIKLWERGQWGERLQRGLANRADTANYRAVAARALACCIPRDLALGCMATGISLSLIKAYYAWSTFGASAEHLLEPTGTALLGAGMLGLTQGMHALAARMEQSPWRKTVTVIAGLAATCCAADDLIPALQGLSLTG